MKYYKITNEDECHRGMQYRTGLNVDYLPFDPSGSCQPGGIYFAREDILAYLNCGFWIREVVVPTGAQVYKDQGDLHKWKADKVILGERRKITADVIRELVAEGAETRLCPAIAFRYTRCFGMMTMLVEVFGPDIPHVEGYTTRGGMFGHVFTKERALDVRLRWAQYMAEMELLISLGAQTDEK